MNQKISNKQFQLQRFGGTSYLLTSVLSAGLLSACGGGGSPSSSLNDKVVVAASPETGWTPDTADKVDAIPVSMTTELCDSGEDEECQAVIVDADTKNTSTNSNASIRTTAATIPADCERFNMEKSYGPISTQKVYFKGSTYTFNEGWKTQGISPEQEKYGSLVWTKDSKNRCSGLAASQIASSQLVEVKFAPPIGDQKSAGTCTAWAASVILSNMANRQAKFINSADRAKPENIASPRHLFTQLTDPTDPQRRLKKNNCNGSNGAETFETVFKMQGVGSLKSAPYAPVGNSMQENDCSYAVYQKNAVTWNADKSKFRIAGVRKIPLEINKIKAEINAGNAIWFGAKLNKEFYQAAPTKVVKRDAFLNAEKSSDSHAAGHAMAIVGYDDGIKAFKVQNSWGDGFGESGYVFIDYDLMVDRVNFTLESNFYTVIPASKATASAAAISSLKGTMSQKSITSLYIDPKNASNISTQASRSTDQISLTLQSGNVTINNPGNTARSGEADPLQYTEAEIVAAALLHLSKLN
jgi:cathepsin K